MGSSSNNINNAPLFHTSPRVKNKSLLNPSSLHIPHGPTAGKLKKLDFENGTTSSNNNVNNNEINLPQLITTNYNSSEQYNVNSVLDSSYYNAAANITPVNIKKQQQQQHMQNANNNNNKLGFTKLEQIYMIKKARKEYGHQYKGGAGAANSSKNNSQ